MGEDKLELIRGTLDLLVLRTLESMGSMHGYGIARRIEHVSGNGVLLNEGTVYASLVRLQHRRWITAEWGTSDNNRKAKFYTLTSRGQRAIDTQTSLWERWSAVMVRVLRASGKGGSS